MFEVGGSVEGDMDYDATTAATTPDSEVFEISGELEGDHENEHAQDGMNG